MSFDWQTVAVLLIVLAALAYTGRRALGRLRSFSTSRTDVAGAPACETGCGSCGGAPKTVGKPAPILLQIERSRGGTRDKKAEC